MKRISADTPQSGRCHAPYLCRDPAATVAAWTLLEDTGPGGGACAWSVVLLLCARALGLISVHDQGWLLAGDMMVGGVIPLGEALRPLGL